MTVSDRPWAPWTPTVGTRVRIQVSPECQADHAESNGTTGTVVSVNWDTAIWGPEPHDDDPAVEAYRGHWFDVQFDAPARNPRASYPIVADLFAAIELEPAP